MSYDINLIDEDGQVVSVSPHEEGGTYVLGGSPQASLNVTYNYGTIFHAAFDGMTLDDAIGGKLASDVLPLLTHAVECLGIKQDTDYWAATEGNAGHALNILRGWAEQHPTAMFSIS